MAKKRTVAQRQRMSAAQKKRYRLKQQSNAVVGITRTVEAVIHAKRLMDATDGNTEMATELVKALGSTY